MKRSRSTRTLPLAIGALLLALVALLATLQYRWIGQVSELESHRLRASLATAGNLFAEDFDHEIARAFLAFRGVGLEDGSQLAPRVARQYRRWLAESPFPRLIGQILYVRAGGRGGPNLAVLRTSGPRFEAVGWPGELEALRRGVAGEGAERFRRLSMLVADPPGLVMPVLRAARGGVPRRELEGLSGGGWEGDFLLVRLDESAITREILPTLARRHFGGAEAADDVVAVVTRDQPARVLFLSDPSVPRLDLEPRNADLVLPFFALSARAARIFERVGGRPPNPGPRAQGGEPEGDEEPRARSAVESAERGGHWRLVVRRRHGSLAQAVAAFRRRNLGVGAGILALLAATTGLMMLTSQRASRLARQQLEFVAAVSHELNTPLTAIRSAGQNLADGVVAQPDQVKRYGNLIETEGRRLSAMVGQVLDFAGIQSGRQAYTLQPSAVGPLLAAALDDCRPLLAERRARVECDVVPGLPPVQADPAALRRALRNLIENAAKYGGPEPWIGVRARAAGDGVEIVVEDRGAGVPGEDLPHLFEPFFRGRDAVAAGSIPGSGLGLAVVRHIAHAHRGRVSVATRGADRGSAFTLHLPAAAET